MSLFKTITQPFLREEDKKKQTKSTNTGNDPGTFSPPLENDGRHMLRLFRGIFTSPAVSDDAHKKRKIIVENKKNLLYRHSLGFPGGGSAIWWMNFTQKKTNKMCTYLKVVVGREQSPSNYDFDDKCRNELVLKDFY